MAVDTAGVTQAGAENVTIESDVLTTVHAAR